MKLYISKRRWGSCKWSRIKLTPCSRLKQNTKIADVEAATKPTDREKLVGQKIEEANLFGIRAIEHGYFGGVSQSRPPSPSHSYILSPSTTVVDWGSSGRSRSQSSSSSVVDSLGSQNGGSYSLQIVDPNKIVRKPSPLRLQSSGAELIGKKSHDPSTAQSIGGSYMPPLPSPRSKRSASPACNEPNSPGWVAPLDIHFIRPTTPNTSRPHSYLPRLQFPGELEKSVLLAPTPSGEVKSETAPINSGASATTEKTAHMSPTLRVFPQQMPSRAARQSSRSIFPVTDERPVSRKGLKGNLVPPVPLLDLPPQLPQFDQKPFLHGDRQWNRFSQNLRDFAAPQKPIPVDQPRAREESPDAPNSRSRAQSTGGSSTYSTRTSILDFTKAESFITHARTRSHSAEAQIRTRERSRSASSKRSKSSHGLSRTQDSIRLHNRKVSEGSMGSSSRRSRDRDQMHFDPSQQHRNRSGSVQGRKVDFDHPRESPFSDPSSIGHSANSSVSSSRSSSTTRSRLVDDHGPVPKLPILELDRSVLDRLSVVFPASTKVHDRSASEASQGSIGDVYDAYYTQSFWAQGPSGSSQVQEINVRSSASLGVPNGNSLKIHLRDVGKRPGPLRFGDGSSVGTIVEMPSPVPSPMVGKESHQTNNH